MKKFYKNFTSIEQSKRLLELGVPADSADCFYEYSSDNLSDGWRYKCFIGESAAIKNNLFSFRNGYTIPCWSVGRLIEILAICFGLPSCAIDWVSFCEGQSPLQAIYDELCAGVTQGLLDFNKLKL